MNRTLLFLVGSVLLAAIGLVAFRSFLQEEAIPSAVAAQAPPAPAAKAPPEPGDQEAGIRKITEEYVKAFNARDAKAAAALWTREGEYIGLNGETIRGHEAVEKSLAEHFKAHPKGVIDVKVESFRRVGRQTVLVEGVVKLKSPDSPDSETRYSALNVVEDGQWRVASVREWLPEPGLGSATKHLDWLVGEWTGKGSNGTISITYSWDETKTFLNSKYSVVKDGKNICSGTQVIGVNATSGGLRSWMFDSNGTVSTASWEQDGNRWIQHTTGTLPDGTELTSVNAMIPLGEDAFCLQTTERAADGVSLPALPPIKIVRVKNKK